MLRSAHFLWKADSQFCFDVSDDGSTRRAHEKLMKVKTNMIMAPFASGYRQTPKVGNQIHLLHTCILQAKLCIGLVFQLTSPLQIGPWTFISYLWWKFIFLPYYYYKVEKMRSSKSDSKVKWEKNWWKVCVPCMRRHSSKMFRWQLIFIALWNSLGQLFTRITSYQARASYFRPVVQQLSCCARATETISQLKNGKGYASLKL